MTTENFSPKLNAAAYKRVGSTGLSNWQAVNELIANSIDAWISTGPKKKLHVDITLDNNPANPRDGRLTITDNASGMSKEELMDSFNFFDTKKTSESRYLGVFGFGFKAATSKIGNKVTVISGNTTKEYYKVIADYEKLYKENIDDFELEIETIKHTTQSKGIFNKSPIGTKIIVDNFNSSFPPDRLEEMLPISWKKFITTEDNNFGKKVEITRKWGKGRKEKIFSGTTPAHPETIKKISETITVGKGNDKQEIKVTGFVGLKTDKKKFSIPTQGLHLYRKGQLVEAYTHQFYKNDNAPKHNYQNPLVGELDIGLDASVTKSKFDKDSEEYKAVRKHLQKILIPYSKEAKLMQELVQDPAKVAVAIAGYKKRQNIKLTKDEQNLLAQGGSLEDDITDDKKTDTTSVDKKTVEEEQVSFKINKWNQFTYEGEKYIITFDKIPLGDNKGSLYSIVPETNEFYVVYFENHPQGKFLEKALNKQDKDEVSALLIRVIVAECIEKFLKSQGCSKSEINECLQKVLKFKLVSKK